MTEMLRASNHSSSPLAVTRIELVVRPRSNLSPLIRFALRLALVAAAAALLALATGCATLTGSATQTIDVVTVDARDRPIAGMSCSASHSGGAESFTSPSATIAVRRSAEPLHVECKRGAQIARGTAVARGESALAHSFIPGGAVASIIDYVSGYMYSYPTPLRLRAGEHLRFEHSDAASATWVENVGSAPAAPTEPAPARTAAVRTTRPAAAPAPRHTDAEASFDARDMRARAAAERR